MLCSTAGRKNFLVSEQCGMGGLGVRTPRHPTPQMCRWQLDLLWYMRSTAKRYDPVAAAVAKGPAVGTDAVTGCCRAGTSDSAQARQMSHR